MKRHFGLIIGLALLFVAGALDGVAAEEPVVLASSAEAKPRPLGEADIAALVRQLDSNRYQEREQATQTLLEAGNAALDPLFAAANSDRPEAADRAVWLLRKFGNSTDRTFALAALARLVQLKDRPAIVAEAQQIQTRLQLAICEEQLAKLGGKLTMVDRPQVDGSIVHTVRVELGDDWRGTVDDLKCLLELDQQHYFCLVGPAVDDDVVAIFETKDDLRLMQIFLSRVTPAAVDALKEHQPKVTVYIRNRALLGIGGETQGNGVRVTQAQDGFGAAKAGIVLGDVVTEIDGKPIPDFDRLTAVISQRQPGDVVEVTILRGGEKLTKKVTLSDQPPEQY